VNTKVLPRELALELCKRSTCRWKMAAVLSDVHGIFAWGWNHMLKDAPEVGAGMHAEHHAIMRANRKRLRGAMLTVAGRYSKSHNNLLSRPCPKCLALAMKYGIKTIEYLTKDGSWETLRLTYQKT